MKKRKSYPAILVSVCILLGLLNGCSAGNMDLKNGQQKTQSAFEYDSTVIEQQEGTADSTKVEEASSPDVDGALQKATLSPETQTETPGQLLQTEKKYYYSCLNSEEQKCYIQMYDCIVNFKKDAEIATLDSSELDYIFKCVMNDYPEIYYVTGYICTRHLQNNEVIKLTFSAEYSMTQEEIANYRTIIDAYTQKVFAQMDPGFSEYEKVKYIYEYLISQTEYDLTAPNNQNICSVFANGKSVCQGYAKATQYLLERLGFEITLVSGDVIGGSPHAWNLILVDGNYYYIDTTWGDVDYQETEGEQPVAKEVMPVNYDYFLITTDELTKTHTIDSIVPMPRCVVNDDNYYVKEGLFFTSVDTVQLESCFQRAREQGEATVTMKCSDAEVFQQLQKFLIDDQKIFEYLNTTDSIAYYDNPEMYTLCFWLE